MSEWYRRSDWNEEIASDFEARLNRARPSSQAQYLSLQGYSLIGSNPVAAEALLERAVATGEPSEMPRAACYLALSRVAQGKVDEAIYAYEVAISAERHNPAFRSTAGVDQAFLIAAFERTELYGKALDQLAMATGEDCSLAGIEALAAESIMRHARGESELARQLARGALREWPDHEQETQWGGISLAALRSRIEAIVE